MIAKLRCRLCFALFVAAMILIGAFGQAAEPLRVRVLSYNIHHGEGVDGRLDLPRIAKVIASVSPDLVALQEVDRNTARTGKVNQPGELARLTGMNVLFERNIVHEGGDYGNAVLSKFAVQKHTNHRLPCYDDGEQRGVLEVELAAGDPKSRFLFSCTHLDHRRDDRERLASAKAINALAAQRADLPAILAGDLNARPDSEVLTEFASMWRKANTENLPTIPVAKPEAQIDYILFRPAETWRTVEVRVLDEAVASDHRAIFAVLELAARRLSQDRSGDVRSAVSAGSEPRADHRPGTDSHAKSSGPPLNIAVDPRVELMSILFRFAGNREYNEGRVKAYVDDVERHFGPYREHAAVQLARSLRQTRGVSFDACMSMAVHVADAYSLSEKPPFEPRPAALDGRWRIDEARQFLQEARRFVEQSSFKKFVDEHQTLYQTAESRMRAMLEKEAHLEWFDQFFGQRPKASFTVALGLLNGGGSYGPHCQTAEGEEELYCILGVWKTDADGLPYFDAGMIGTVVHEFCHSYANGIVDRRESELRAAGEKIFPHVEAAMRRQAYSNWKTMMYESLVRACSVRYARQYQGRIAAWMQVKGQQQRQFLWTGELSELLAEYETNRDKYPTLDAFAPRIVDFFNQYADKFAKAHEGETAKQPKVVSMTPADEASNVDPALAAIRVVFDRPMKDQSWSLVGGGPNFPEVAGKPAYDATLKVWTAPVKLRPNWSYQFMLNSDRFQAFQSQEGVPLAPVTASFKTGG